jgi:16S rRNA (uracil1498-N3)-methyltransferase
MNIFIAIIENDLAYLEAEESWHCCKVLRKKAGDKIAVIDGKGLFAEGILDLVSEKKCKMKLLTKPTLQQKRNYHLHLAIAPTKQIDRIEWMIEKAVEIGLDELSFIQCKNSERVNLKTDRIQKIVESATKQSLQAYLPKVNSLKNFNELVHQAEETQKLIAHCNQGDKTRIIDMKFKNTSTLILIGPEGDFCLDEINDAITKDFIAVSLGENRLRTETAGLYACQAAALLSQIA